MSLISAKEKRAERRESLLLNIGTGAHGWRRTAQQVLAKVKEERVESSVFKAMEPERFQKLADRGFWTMLERDGYTILQVEGGVRVSW